MPIALVFFVHYAYLIIFLWVLVEQVGIPIPSVPVLLTAGTLSATHRVSWLGITIAMLLACIVADTVWFSLGRRYGNSVLKLLCRLSFEASTCVSKTEGYFTRRGAVTLLLAKFVPGLSTVAAPIVDLRPPLEYLPDPRVLPGALRIGPNELRQHSEIIPRDRDVILYCTCPSEETSAKLALQLHKMGVYRVRPLRGGFDGWKEAGYPLVDYVTDTPTSPVVQQTLPANSGSAIPLV